MADEPQGNEGYISEMDIRIWIRDKDPAANLLLEDYEFSPEEIRTAVTLAVDKWNDTPPFMSGYHYTVDSFPFRSALLTGAVANLLTIAGHRYRRNRLNYTVPGGAVDDKNKATEYDAAAARLAQEYTLHIQHIKRSLNMEQGWAVIS